MEKIVLNVRSAQRDPMLLTIDLERCQGCGICVDYCPKHVLVLGPGPADSQVSTIVHARRPADCRACALCQLYCPDAAITVHERREPPSAVA